ncbi:MAG: SDR family NAD(P)-dependent oxidoreductase [Pseudomonadota bacterium]
MKRTALITGANRGIGRALATGLAAREGMRVIAASRREEDAVAVAATIGGDTTSVALDLSDPEAAARQALELEAEFGAIDILINNAGILTPGNALEASLEQVNQSIATNALSPLALTQVFGSSMKKRGWGRIVNLSSGWGSFAEGLSGPAAYAISKATLNAVTLSAAQALGRSVKVNAACPGWVRTRMGGQAASRSPEEGADTAIWLATLDDDGPTGGFWRDRRLIEW